MFTSPLVRYCLLVGVGLMALAVPCLWLNPLVAIALFGLGLGLLICPTLFATDC